MKDLISAIYGRKASFRTLIKQAVLTTYCPDGFDLHNGKVNNDGAWYCDKESAAYLSHPLTLLSSFLGFPNRMLIRYSRQSLTNLVLNFIGWQPGKNALQIMLFLLILTPINTVRIPFLFVQNLIKLLTELSPALLLVFSRYLRFLLSAIWEKMHLLPGQKWYLGIVIIPCFSPALILIGITYLVILFSGTLWYFIGSSITSPISLFDSAISAPMRKGDTTGAIILGTLIVLQIAVVNTILLPLLLKLVVLHWVPFILKIIPPTILAILNSVSIQTYGAIFADMAKWILKVETLGLFSLAITNGLAIGGASACLGFLFGVIFTLLGSPICRGMEVLRNKWHATAVALQTNLFRPIPLPSSSRSRSLALLNGDEAQDSPGKKAGADAISQPQFSSKASVATVVSEVQQVEAPFIFQP